MRRILFILNPTAGAKKLKLTPQIIQSHFTATDIETTCEYSQYPGHSTVLTKTYVEKGYTDIVAIGGDGSVRDVAVALVHTDVRLGIIPTGSGNALARHLGIPCHSERSIDIIKEKKNIVIDVGKMNDQYFFANCGLGIDAKIIHNYDQIPQRGFWTYFKISIKTYFTHKPEPLSVHYKDGIKRSYLPELFIVSLGSQFGYNVKITPEASLTDGLFDLYIAPKLNVFLSAWAGIKALMGKQFNHKKITRKLVSQLTVTFDGTKKIQFDGEPFVVENKIEFELIPKGIQVIIPEKSIGMI